MSSTETKEEKKARQEAEQNLRNAGVIPLRRNFVLEAGERVETAWVWIPRLRLVIVVAMGIAVASLLGSVYAVYSRPAAEVFLSHADGSISCGPVGTATGKILSRTRAKQAVCDRLSPPPRIPPPEGL